MAAWRLARSLETLRDEIRSVYPGTTVWTIGDQSHASGWSDHNPTSSGVVCAIDVLGDKGLNLASFAEHLKKSNHKAIKYVIHNRRIWSKEKNSQGWRAYNGSNPHTTHVHVSVGVGPDGRSTGPYDDTSAWGISSGGSSTSEGMFAMLDLKKGDKGRQVVLLQTYLEAAGASPGEKDGIWGAKTSEALLKIQRSFDSNIKTADSVTPWAIIRLQIRTAERLAKAPSAPSGGWLPVRKGDSGEDVQLVQLLLIDCGEQVKADAKYGTETVAALKSFWKKIKPNEVYAGEHVTAHVMRELYRGALKGAKGDPGKLTLPVGVEISGTITKVG